MYRSCSRQGVTLVEVLIALAIMAVLISLLLPAIQLCRAEAGRLQSKNKLRQLTLATHNYAAANGDALPGYGRYDLNEGGWGVFEPVLPFLEEGRIPIPNPYHLSYGNFVPAYVSPADRSFTQPYIVFTSPASGTHLSGDHSYPANWQAFRVGTDLTRSFPDGTSTTMVFTERYARCAMTGTLWSISSGSCRDPVTGNNRMCINPIIRRPTFADPDYDDVLPVTAGGVTRPSVAGRTFQLVPTIDECDYRMPQTPHTNGMLTAYMDGSVRTTRKGIAPEVFWAAVTPAGGEVVADGW